jgi:hypothetical protein
VHQKGGGIQKDHADTGVPCLTLQAAYQVQALRINPFCKSAIPQSNFLWKWGEMSGMGFPLLLLSLR